MKRSWKRRLVITLLSFVALAALVPLINASALHGPITHALSKALGRTVEASSIRLSLWRGPAFRITDVVVYDAADFGAEPLAYVSELDARLHPLALLFGQLKFSSLYLNEPRVNLARNAKGEWNVHRFFLEAADRSKESSLPALHVSDGRVDVKLDNIKQILYFSAADLAIDPAGSGLYDIQFSTSPSRTDRQPSPPGMLSGQGTWNSHTGALDLNVEVARTPLAEFFQLAGAADPGWQGLLYARAHVGGPWSALQARGFLRMEGVQRWTWLNRGSVTLPWSARINLPAQQIAFHAGGAPDLPLSVDGVILSAFSRPKISLAAKVDGLQLSPLPQLLRLLGWTPPRPFSLAGKVYGSLSYAPDQGLLGAGRIEDLMLEAEDEPAILCRNVSVSVTPAALELNLPGLRRGSERFDSFLRYDFERQSGDVTLSLTQGPLPSLISSPALVHFVGGLWSGMATYRFGPDLSGFWSGSFLLRDGGLRVPVLRRPMQLRRAEVEFSPNALELKALEATASGTRFLGQARYSLDTGAVHLDLAGEQLDLALLESELRAALYRQPGLLARTLGLGSKPQLAWESLQVEGRVRLQELNVGPGTFRNVRARLAWSGRRLRFNFQQIDYGSALAAGSVTVHFQRSGPEYSLVGKVQHLAWRSGRIDATVRAQTRGFGSEALLNLQASGELEGRGIHLSPENVLRWASAQYELRLGRDGPRAVLSNIQAVNGTETFAGSGATQPDGHLLIELASARRTLVMRGPLVPFHLDLLSPASAP